MTVDTELLQQINDVITKKQAVTDVFDSDGYIRLNMIYIFPHALVELHSMLTKTNELIKMYFTEKTLIFEFMNNKQNSSNLLIKLEGTLSITKNQKTNKIFALEMDFEQPEITTRKVQLQMQRIEFFKMKSDVFFFMIYEFDFDEFILKHPIHESIDLLTLEFRRKQRSSLLKEEY